GGRRALANVVRTGPRFLAGTAPAVGGTVRRQRIVRPRVPPEGAIQRPRPGLGRERAGSIPATGTTPVRGATREHDRQRGVPDPRPPPAPRTHVATRIHRHQFGRTGARPLVPVRRRA